MLLLAAMFPEAVKRYHDLLANQELAEASRALLDEGLEQAKLIFGGRRLSPYLRPHFVSETDFARICQICETVWSAIQKVKDAAVADPKVVDDLGLTEIERELVSIDPGYAAVSPTSRLDSFLTQSAYSFVELNGESPAGIAYADAAYDIFSSLPVMKEFAADYNVRPMYGRRFMLDVLLSSYEEFLGRKPERPPRIAIVDLPDVPTVKEFELFREFFEQSGYPSVICTPQELEFSNNRLSVVGPGDRHRLQTSARERVPADHARVSRIAQCLPRRRDLHGQQFSFEADSQESALCSANGSAARVAIFSKRTRSDSCSRAVDACGQRRTRLITSAEHQPAGVYSR